MCIDCEMDEPEPLREVYLARRARMAQTWTPPGRRWLAEPVAAVAVRGSAAQPARAEHEQA